MTVERRDIAQAFAQAKRRLARSWGEIGPKNHEFICHCLQELRTDAGDCAEGIIMKRLNGHFTLNDWLIANVPNADNTDSVKFRIQMQQYRHRWLDELIREFSK